MLTLKRYGEHVIFMFIIRKEKVFAPIMEGDTATNLLLNQSIV